MSKVENSAVDPEAKFKEEQVALEREHGPMVFLSFRGATFGFKRMTRAEFVVRQNRIRRNDSEADDRLLQERCEYPSRDVWNDYVGRATFEAMTFADGYRAAHGGADTVEADSDEVPEGAHEKVALWLANGKGAERPVFGFRQPGRAEVKMFRDQLLAEQRGEKLNRAPLETLLRAVSETPDFLAWLDDNLFGIGSFGEALLTAFGIGDAREASKK